MRTSAKNPLTAHRESILRVVERSRAPITAELVHRALKNVDLATVYRALYFLAQTRRITEFVVDCSEEGIVRYYYPLREPHLHFFHCTSCHRFIPYDGCSVSDSLSKFERESGCAVRTHALSLSGLCAACNTGDA
ncbi:MAG: transcriptional repressor [Spirochaetota bacterium]